MNVKESAEQQLEKKLSGIIRDRLDAGQLQDVGVISFYSSTAAGLEKVQAGGAYVTVAIGPRETEHRQTRAVRMPVRVTLVIGVDYSPSALAIGYSSSLLTGLFEQLELNDDSDLDELGTTAFDVDGFTFVSGGDAQFNETFSRWIVQYSLEISGRVKEAATLNEDQQNGNE